MTIPKPFRLLIPRKTQKPVQQPDYGTDMRAIEIWAQALVAYVDSITGGGFVPYASLTGAGETVSPGDLTQQGGFTVDDSAGHGVSLLSIGGTIQATSVGAEVILGAGTGGTHAVLTLENTGSSLDLVNDFTILSTSGTITIEGNGTGGLVLGVGAHPVRVGGTGGTLGFFGTSPSSIPTVTGSRGGNAALASLLTGLDGLGLIVDSSSP